MSIKYGSLDKDQPRKKRAKSIIHHDDSGNEKISGPALKARLAHLAYQNRAPHVAVRAADTLLERVEPRKGTPESQLTAAEAMRICDIYERIFGADTESTEPVGLAVKRTDLPVERPSHLAEVTVLEGIDREASS